MVKQNAIKVFEEKSVRTVWDSDKGEWYFSIVDAVAVLTDSKLESVKKEIIRGGELNRYNLYWFEIICGRWQNAIDGCC